jgi:RHS repeat-associated protein
MNYRGNVTVSTGSGKTTNLYYDITGTVYQADDNHGLTIAVDPAAGSNNAAPGLITPNSNSNLAESMTWTSFLGLSSRTTPNSSTSNVYYDDQGRVEQTKSPHGAETNYVYTNLPYTVKATTNGHWTKTTHDGLGRVIKTETGEGTTTYSIVDSEYAACACSPLGKRKRVSQPYAPGGTVYWTTYTFDALGRTLTVTQPDNSGTTTYVYEGNTVKITDPAGKWKKFTYDAFGNLVQVTEPRPGGGADYETYYAYNVRDQLTTVTMPRDGATQTRTFVYDLANGRLSTATNPENGTVTYWWNGNGTLDKRRDAKNQEIRYSYDSYRRPTQIRRYPVYNGAEDTCQRVDLSYDTNPYDGTFTQNGQGRLTATRWAGSSCEGQEWREYYSYTTAGLVTKKRLVRATANRYLEASWTHDNEGRMVSVTYPNGGKTYTYSFDALGRPTKLTDNSAVDWAKDVLYNAAGQMTQIKYTTNGTNGSYYTETRQFNALNQLTRLTVPGVIDHEYRFSATQNNGHITQRKDWISGEEITYQYDSLQRLISAETTGPEWGQSFTFDGFGNLLQQTVTKGSAPSLSVLVDTATNHITTSGYAYDANGNLTAMPTLSSLVYDVDNRLITATHTSNGTDQYRYDPSNRRVWKKKPDGTQETYFYGLDGRKLGTYSGGTAGTPFATVHTNVYFAGKLIWAEGAAAVTDRLGSVVSGNRKYFPYGEEPTTTGQDKTKFATYYRDATTALDYAVNRFYGRTIGRFLTTDPSGTTHVANLPQRDAAPIAGPMLPTQMPSTTPGRPVVAGLPGSDLIDILNQMFETAPPPSAYRPLDPTDPGPLSGSQDFPFLAGQQHGTPTGVSELGSADLERPQSWNRYAYVEGDPINSVDPEGLQRWSAQTCKALRQAQGVFAFNFAISAIVFYYAPPQLAIYGLGSAAVSIIGYAVLWNLIKSHC